MPANAIPLPLPEPSEEEEAPKCPPPGAPAWMATFADIAILLMAFFVLILSFAEFNQPKFKQVAGSLKQAFGVQREIPVMEQPKGTTVLELKFSPSPDVSVTEELTQDTTDTTRPEVVTAAEQDSDGTGRDGDAENEAAKAVAQAIMEATDDPDLEVEQRGSNVVVNLENVDPSTLPEQLLQMAAVLASEKKEASETPPNVLLEGLDDRLEQLARAAQTEGDSARAAEKAQLKAALADAQLRVALRQETGEGLVTVEQRKDKVVVTVGAGGAFPSGTADLTDQARQVMARIAAAAMGDASDIVVTGHTDSVPLSPGSPFGDNWGLAAARASSVVRELQAAQSVSPGRMSALSRGETSPIADNETASGRERNRRIEIEFQY